MKKHTPGRPKTAQKQRQFHPTLPEPYYRKLQALAKEQYRSAASQASVILMSYFDNVGKND